MDDAPDHTREQSNDARLFGELWTLRVDHVTASLVGEFDARGIASILLKGPTFALRLYDTRGERTYVDSDLLVQASDLERAQDALRDCGFVRVDRDEDWVGPEPKYAYTYRRPSDNAMVDLHWRLSGTEATPEQIWAVLARHRETMSVAGTSVSIPDDAFNALLVALHSAHHGNSQARTSRDLEQAVKRFDFEVWNQASALAVTLSALPRFAAGMRLSPAGDSLADRLELPHIASVEMWLKTHPSTYGAWALERFARARTGRAKLRIARQIVAPPPVIMFSSFRLARRGKAGLVLSYLMRPVRLLAQVGPVLWELGRAYRAVHANTHRT